MLKWKWICKISGCVYPLKKLPTPDYLKNMTSMFNRFNRSKEEETCIADTDKPCVRCGKIEE